MPRFTHLLDTSALLTHFFDEGGADDVAELWRDGANHLAVSVLSIPELETRLRLELGGAEDVDEVSELYFGELTTPVAIDRKVAEEAARLRIASPARLPLVDACIAACARVHGCLLVHKDPHFSALPPDLVRQHRLDGRR